MSPNKKLRFISVLTEVVKKLRGYIKRKIKRDRITIKIHVTMEGNQNTLESKLDFEIKVKTFDMNKNELIDAIASGSKLTKADAGKIVGHEDVILLRIEPTPTDNGVCGCPKVEISINTKTIPLCK